MRCLFWKPRAVICLGCFLEPIQQADTAAIQSIMAIYRDIMALGVLKRFDLAQTLRTMEQGKKAVKAYTS